MPIRADQLKEKEDYQHLILERLNEDNDFRIRPNSAFNSGLAMDTELLIEFLDLHSQRQLINCIACIKNILMKPSLV